MTIAHFTPVGKTLLLAIAGQLAYLSSDMPPENYAKNPGTTAWLAAKLEDMRLIAGQVLGPERDPETDRKLWWLVDDPNSLTGKAVRNGRDYFVYGRSIYLKPSGPESETDFGLLRAHFDRKHRLVSIGSQAIRHANEEYKYHKPSFAKARPSEPDRPESD